jgi:hypothetical protein
MFSGSLRCLVFVLPFLCLSVHAAAPPAPGSAARELPPHPKSVTDFFRQLLIATPAQQTALLAEKPAAVRSVLEKKLEEYRALPPDECEIRLRALDLRWHLTSLMLLPATNRAPALAAVPEKDRYLVADRLTRWDLLPSDLQKEVLASDTAMALLVGGRLPGSTTPPPIPNNNQHEVAITRWQQIPAARRTAIYGHLRNLVHPSPVRPPAPLMSAGDQQINVLLEKIKVLPPEQRVVCLQNFQKFVALSGQERVRFRRTAVRWQQLSEEEKRLAKRLPPPPPGLDLLGRPPSPAGFSAVTSNAAIR